MNLEGVYLVIKKDKFYFLKFILEGYDGLAILSSSKIRKDVVLVRYPAEKRNEIFSLLNCLAPKLNPYFSDISKKKNGA